MRSMGASQSAAEGHLDAVAARNRATLALPPGAAHELRRVESRLRAAARTRDSRLVEMALHVIDAGGKRLRPTLVLASAMAVGGQEAVTDRVLDAAVAVELVHLASLYHDDVLDRATTRRGRPSVNARWGNHTAVLGGDVLLSHAYRVAADLGSAELRRLCQTLTELCSGQIAETEAQFDPARGIREYDASIRGKTAALLSTSCWLGATIAGGSADRVEALAQFGMEIGVAFQIVDDVLDLYGHSHAIGKPAGSDLREGVFTLPVLMTLLEDPALQELLVEGIDERGVDEVARRVRAAGADRRAVARAFGHLRAGLDALSGSRLAAEGTQVLVSLAPLGQEPLERLGLGGAWRARAPLASIPEAGAA